VTAPLLPLPPPHLRLLWLPLPLPWQMRDQHLIYVVRMPFAKTGSGQTSNNQKKNEQMSDPHRMAMALGSHVAAGQSPAQQQHQGLPLRRRRRVQTAGCLVCRRPYPMCVHPHASIYI